ncbi:pilus assembly protein CpaE [Actibacterium mucosum KCTC 23349]|uniref:Pilus assembly protein CpaE n=1 Tax=Actibacterium mucosum KCTC 23349 TaxID=1454373 RepID=A0A037ZEN7_9RHOB|nr:AAA family ATPase [Actibacterium mucosum]KAJ54083.1 pilus assembly protein CpaE [Actibacterium mucosum KCTC 23349]
MASIAALQPEPAPIVACTVSRDIQNFDQLIEDMEAELGEGWGDLSFEDASAFFGEADAENLEFVAIAVNSDDEGRLDLIENLVRTAKEARIGVILIADELGPMVLHKLLRLGADDFVPYPLPQGALREAIEKLRTPSPAMIAVEVAQQEQPEGITAVGADQSRDGVVLPVHGLAGGVGASTFAVNLAWELALADKKEPPRVCLLDFDLQFGSASTYLDLPRRDAVYELVADTEAMDNESFVQATLPFNEKLHVLTAPSEILPLDFIVPDDVNNLIDRAQANFDFVVIDMPRTLVQWTETVLNRAHVYFALVELDMRSAQNTLRMIRALKSEDLPHEKLRYVLNRSPKFTDLSGKSRVKRMAENLDIDIEVMLPDGGKAVAQAGDHGLPLAETAAKLPLRKEIQKLAAQLYAHAVEGSAAAVG